MPCSRCGKNRPARPNPPSGTRRPGTVIPGKPTNGQNINRSPKEAITGLKYVPESN